MDLKGETGRWYQCAASPLAEGGQATVWPARPVDTKVPASTTLHEDSWPLAIKIAHPGAIHEEALWREGLLLGCLSEQAPGLSPRLIDEVVTESGLRGVVMERYPLDADAYVQNQIRSLPSGRALEELLAFVLVLVRQVARLHAVTSPRGGRIVHRDLKPDNILVSYEGRPVLADLAAAAEVDTGRRLACPSPGTPVWAPYEQCLAASPEPDPTWDTYACGVMLFWWLTGIRPAFQDDPSPLLTPAGREVYAALEQARDREGWTRLRALQAALQEGGGLIDPRGHAAIQPADEAALRSGVRRLGSPLLHGDAALRSCARSLGHLLARCLSPLSHPSPPNRFWRADDLVEELASILEDLRQARLRRRRSAALAGVGAAAFVVLAARAGASLATGGGVGLPLPALPTAGVATAAVAEPAPTPDSASVAILAEPPEVAEPARIRAVAAEQLTALHALQLQTAMSLPPVRIPAPAGGKDFWLDRFEVPVAAYVRCQQAGACEVVEGLAAAAPELPAVGVTWQQAAAYCAHAAGRLPTADELAHAAGRRSGAPAVSCSQANLGGCEHGRLVPIYALPQSASADGVYHLIGNAWEWTSTAVTTHATRRSLFGRVRREPVSTEPVLMGGAFDADPEQAALTARHHAPARTATPDLSFRCAYDALPPRHDPAKGG